MGSTITVVAEERTSILHIARTTIAALASQLIAQALHMPEPYWATVTTIVIMQSSLGAAWMVSWKRLEGTVLGAAVGGALASHFGGNLTAFRGRYGGKRTGLHGLRSRSHVLSLRGHHAGDYYAGDKSAVGLDHRGAPVCGGGVGNCSGPRPGCLVAGTIAATANSMRLARPGRARTPVAASTWQWQHACDCQVG